MVYLSPTHGPQASYRVYSPITPPLTPPKGTVALPEVDKTTSIDVPEVVISPPLDRALLKGYAFPTTAASAPITPPRRRSPGTSPSASPIKKHLSLNAIQTNGLLTPPDSPSPTPPRRKSPPASPNLSAVNVRLSSAQGFTAETTEGPSSPISPDSESIAPLSASGEKQVPVQSPRARSSNTWGGLFVGSPKLRRVSGDVEADVFGDSTAFRVKALTASPATVLVTPPARIPSPPTPLPIKPVPTLSREPSTAVTTVMPSNRGEKHRAKAPVKLGTWGGLYEEKPKLRFGDRGKDGLTVGCGRVMAPRSKAWRTPLSSIEVRAWSQWTGSSNSERRARDVKAAEVFQVGVDCDPQEHQARLQMFRSVLYQLYIESQAAARSGQLGHGLPLPVLKKATSPTDVPAVYGLLQLRRGPRAKPRKRFVKHRKTGRHIPVVPEASSEHANVPLPPLLTWHVAVNTPKAPSKLSQTVTAGNLKRAAKLEGQKTRRVMELAIDGGVEYGFGSGSELRLDLGFGF